MDLETLVVTILDRIEEANHNDADEFCIRLNRKQIKEVADAWREVDYIEIY